MGKGPELFRKDEASLQKKELLHCRRDFLHVKEKATVYMGKRIVVQITESPDDETRLGIIVSRRYNKSSVKRNRARRLIREAYRLIKNRIFSPVWLVIIARKGIADCKRQVVQQELIDILTSANAYSSTDKGCP
jgi:ribonuclease P protein component